MKPEHLAPYEGKDYTAFLLQKHETSTGVHFDINLVGDFCKRNNLFLIVDTISTFLCDPFDMTATNTGIMITGSQKALACAPGIAVMILAPSALKRVEENKCCCQYLDLKLALKNMERGQTPWTPAVGILRQINVRLKEIEAMGGADAEIARCADLAKYFRDKLVEYNLPFEIISESLSNAVTPLHPTTQSAYEIFLKVKDEYGMWICPNGGEMKDTVFRVGHIGYLHKKDYDKLSWIYGRRSSSNMVKVITYGTYDLLHYGHIRLLERAKALGDYLIVGVTADGFDQARGKINVQQSLMERIEAVKATGLADEIVIEEYEGQKIDDIKRYDVDIFTVGSDWKGHFDYLNEFCKVVYLDRTEGVSSSEIRSEKRTVRIGLVGELPALNKFCNECKFVNGASISGVYTLDNRLLSNELKSLPLFKEYQELLDNSDAVYIYSSSKHHYEQALQAIRNKKHVLCESPLALSVEQFNSLRKEAQNNHVVLLDSIKTAYSTAYYRLLLMVKSGVIGEVVSVDSICTSQTNLRMSKAENFPYIWNSMSEWGPTAMLPIFQLMGTDYKEKIITTRIQEGTDDFDLFTKIAFIYPHGVASMKIGQGVKSEGELIISGTEGYIYVPAPWWKTDYFEVRFENPANNKRYFYQLEGEGIRYEIVSFLKTIQHGTDYKYIDSPISEAMVKVIQDFDDKKYIQI